MLPSKHLRAMLMTMIHVHADAGGDDRKIQAMRPETGVATEMRVGDAPNVPKEMKKAVSLARKYDRPIQTKKLTKKDHDHDHAAADVAGVAEGAIVMRVETENRLPDPITTMTPC